MDSERRSIADMSRDEKLDYLLEHLLPMLEKVIAAFDRFQPLLVKYERAANVKTMFSGKGNRHA